MHFETAEIIHNKNIFRLIKHDLAIDGVKMVLPYLLMM